LSARRGAERTGAALRGPGSADFAGAGP